MKDTIKKLLIAIIKTFFNLKSKRKISSKDSLEWLNSSERGSGGSKAPRGSDSVLTRRPAHDPAAQDMEVNMEDYLTCIAIAVQDKAESSLCDSLPMSYNVRNVEKTAEKMIVLLRNVKERGNMFSGNYDSMDRGLGVDILEGECCLILVND